jgi:hypothetical protein
MLVRWFGHRASWICFYAFCEDDQNFQLITSGYSPEREIKVREEESREEELERLQDEFERQEEGSERSSDESERSEQKDFFKRWDGETNSGKVLIPLLARLALRGTEARPANRLQRFVERNPSGFDRTSLLFRTMTTILAISALKLSGRRPLDPRREEPLLPSAPSLYLYTKDGSHVGTAWVHSEELYSKIVSSTSIRKSVLDAEVAVIAGPVRADWRTREECPSERQIMNELVEAGGNARDILARHMMRGRYHSEIDAVLLDMLKEHHPETYNLLPIEELELDDQFWEVLEERVRQLNFPGHKKEALETFKEILMNTNSHLRVDLSVSYILELLIVIGNLGGEILSDMGKATEVLSPRPVRHVQR